MRYIKKSLSLLLGVFLIFGLSGCGFDLSKKTPTEVVSQSLDDIKSGDSDSILNMLNEDFPIIFKKNTGLKELLPLSSEKMEHLLKNITYKVNSEKVNGDNAEVSVTVKGPDLEEPVDKMMAVLVKDIKSGELGKDNFDLKNICEKYDKELSGLLNNAKTSERTDDIELEKKLGRWKIEDKDELFRLAVNINPDDYDDKYDISSSDLLKLLGK